MKKTRYNKSKELIEKSFRCQHKTRYEPTRDAAKVLKANPNRRLQHMGCDFMIVFKCLEDRKYELTLEWNHNHSIICLTYKDISDITKTKIISYFYQNLPPSLAYKEHVKEIKSECTADDKETSTICTRIFAKSDMDPRMERKCLTK